MKNINGNNKKLIPKIGFGTWQIQKEKTCEVVLKAIELGYKHFDTAEGYGNLEEIGLAIKNSKIDRSQLFITSKLWVEDYKNEYIQKKAVNRILNQLEVDYVDLLLLHWPLEYNFDVNSILSNLNILKERGLVKNIGVSNFSKYHLEKIDYSLTTICCNQIELHPSFYPKNTILFCKEKNIEIIGYMPFAWGKDFSLDIILDLARKYKVSSAQICLQWQLQKGFKVIPRTINESHMKENLKFNEFILSDIDINKIDNINLNNRILNKEYLRSKVPEFNLDWRMN